MSIDPEDLLRNMMDDSAEGGLDFDSEEFNKFRMGSTDGFLVDKYKISQTIPDEEFTEDFAQGQIKALNFLNSGHRSKMQSALSQPPTDDNITNTLRKVQIPLICIAVSSQVGMMFDIHDRAKEMDYKISLFARFTDEELDDLEDERISKLHGWEDDDE